ncbi:hypothetical protein Tco_0145735 [Tanacetum coccineum]
MAKKERVKSIALKAKKESSDDETLTSGSDDEEYAMAVRNFKKFFRKKGAVIQIISLRFVQTIIDNKIQRAFIGGSWSDSKNDAEDKTNDKTCLMAQSSNEVTLNSSYYSDNVSSLGNDNMQIKGKETDEISTLHQSRRRKLHIDYGDDVGISSDDIRTIKRRRQDYCDAVRM